MNLWRDDSLKNNLSQRRYHSKSLFEMNSFDGLFLSPIVLLALIASLAELRSLLSASRLWTSREKLLNAMWKTASFFHISQGSMSSLKTGPDSFNKRLKSTTACAPLRSVCRSLDICSQVARVRSLRVADCVSRLLSNEISSVDVHQNSLSAMALRDHERCCPHFSPA